MSKNTNLVPMKENKLLVEVIIGGFLGALSGIILGLFLGLIIWGISHVIAAIGDSSALALSDDGMAPPLSAVTFMGMGAGAVLGAAFGANAGLKQQK